MDEKNKFVFDFTDERIFSDTKKMAEYYKLNGKPRESYKTNKVEACDKKITVTITNVDKEVYECVYEFIPSRIVLSWIKQGVALKKLRGKYIKGFDITRIKDWKEHKLVDIDASYSFWDGNTIFMDICFTGKEVLFEGANFAGGYISFESVDFSKSRISFEKVNFGEHDLYFTGAQFPAYEVSFLSACFGKGKIHFVRISSLPRFLSFAYAKFYGSVLSFNDIQFNNEYISTSLGFSKAKFQEATLRFEEVTFDKVNVSFEDAQMDKVVYFRCAFQSDVDFNFAQINELSIQECNNERIMICNGFDYKKLSFMNTINHGEIHIDLNSRNIAKAIANGICYDISTREERASTNEDISRQFKMLKNNFHNMQENSMEDKAQFLYMKYQKKSLSWRNSFFRKLNFLFMEIMSGYGMLPQRILAMMLVLIIGFGLIFSTQFNRLENQTMIVDLQYDEIVLNDVELTYGNVGWISDNPCIIGIYFSAITFLTIGYGDISPPNLLTASLASVEGFLGLVLISYFTVTFTRKVFR